MFYFLFYFLKTIHNSFVIPWNIASFKSVSWSFCNLNLNHNNEVWNYVWMRDECETMLEKNFTSFIADRLLYRISFGISLILCLKVKEKDKNWNHSNKFLRNAVRTHFGNLIVNFHIIKLVINKIHFEQMKIIRITQ